MNKLRYLQTQFQDYLLNSNSLLQTHIINTKKVSAETRLSIYQNAYQARLIEALAANYPVMQSYLGDDAFNELGQAYLEVHPSTMRSIRWFGDRLPQFLIDHSSYKNAPHLAELSQFEWTLTLAFDAADEQVITIEEMASIAPDFWVNMQLQFHSSLHRLRFFWNVIPIWQAISANKTPAKPIKSSKAVDWIVWRKQLINQFYSLTKDEAWAIDCLLNGKTFSELCEGLCQWNDADKAPLRAAALLKNWIAQEMIAKIIPDH